MINVKVIQTSGVSSLVEWVDESGQLRRGHIPASAVVDGTAKEYDLDLSIPYGIPFAEIIQLKATPELFEKRLHQLGIWTYDDLVKRPQEVLAALQYVYGLDLAALRSATLKHVKEI